MVSWDMILDKLKEWTTEMSEWEILQEKRKQCKGME